MAVLFFYFAREGGLLAFRIISVLECIVAGR